MPELIPTNKFLEDLEAIRRDAALRKKVAKTLRFLETNPLHPRLNLERIINDPTAWSVRVDDRRRLSLEPQAHLPAGKPDWSAPLVLLRLLDHDDLYKHPRYFPRYTSNQFHWRTTTDSHLCQPNPVYGYRLGSGRSPAQRAGRAIDNRGRYPYDPSCPRFREGKRSRPASEFFSWPPVNGEGVHIIFLDAKENDMITTRITPKGDVFIPRDIRLRRRWPVGQAFTVIETDDGILLKPSTPFPRTSLEGVAGCLRYDGPAKTLEDMEKAIEKGVMECWHDRR